MSRRRLALVIAVVILGRVGSGAADNVDAAYQQSFVKWKAELVDDLKQNWLTLAGLFWLKPGENTFGSDKSNAVVFPSGPAHARKTGKGGEAAAGYFWDAGSGGDGQLAHAGNPARFAYGDSAERCR